MLNNRDAIGKCLELLSQGLYPYVEQKMRLVYGNQWLTQSGKCLSQDTTLKRTIEESLQQDISSLLLVIVKRWEQAFKEHLSPVERAFASEIIDIRHKWAHNTPFSTKDAERAIDTIHRLLQAIEAEQSQEVGKYQQKIFQILIQEQNRSQKRTQQLSNQEIRIKERLAGIIDKIPFENVNLLERSLTHRSYAYENRINKDNEQFEFLGDCILGFLAGTYIYEVYGDISEGELSKLKERLVDNPQLAKLANQLNLGQWILLGRGEKLQDGSKKESLLSNTFEAIIGAYYLDAGIQAVKELVDPLFASVVEDKIPEDISLESLENPKGLLQQKAQKNGFDIPTYTTIRETGQDHDKEFTVQVEINGKIYGQGRGKNKKEAEKQAAINALQKLKLI
ncbi:ribonuclease III [Sphaerospermopsis aphanizomenoides BCCUSP55]|uniref:ribonuclease III n=1 Tax=Sphaerospermopsis aphanizomenoides TaxID=459663 RepID=UPI000A6975D8|nr:ribonuclease III [Sphaerospermopsis aphanizomenoides]MBK1990236.1 ribonuclease III [Sphaerospermopsis aphanizomenoides BCCUSP55]